MGFFSAIVGAAKDANDDAHGERLLREVRSTFSTMDSLSVQQQNIVMMGYNQIMGKLLGQMPNWSREGRIDIARKMQSQAREAFDTDVTGAYSKWLGGAWLESGERRSSKAQQAYSILNALADDARRAFK